MILPFLVLLLIGTAQAETLTGHPRVVDADTLAYGEERVRVEGIDAPEMRQSCRSARGDTYKCGVVATEALKARIGSDPVTCEGDSRGRYGRLIGFCYFADGTDLNGWVVRQGHAMAYKQYSEKYVSQEDQARAEGLGIWQGKFIEPWNWRRGERLEDK